MHPRRIPIFFYGLFMDAEVLRARDIEPQAPRRGYIRGYALVVTERAALVPEQGETVAGIVMDLAHEEIVRLYSSPDVAAYRPEAALVELDGGQMIAALMFTLPNPVRRPPEAARSYELALRRLRGDLGLPPGW